MDNNSKTEPRKEKENMTTDTNRLMHYGAHDYETAKGIMATNVRKKFEASIFHGQHEAQKVLEQIDREVPQDRVIKTSAMKFVPTGNGVEVLVGGESQETIHDHALGQFCSRGKFNLKYGRQLEAMATEATGEGKDSEWARELLAHNLNELYQRGPASGKRYLMRSVDTQVRGFLSDRYRRLDCRPLLKSFHEMAIQQAGAVPMRGYALATKVAIRVVLPTIFEPIPNQPMLYGLEWGNSDFGHGGHTMRAFIHQPFCTNECTRDDVLRQVHRGGQLSEDFAYSQKTYELDQLTSESALKDTIKGLLQPAAVDATMLLLKKAHDEKIEPKKIPLMLKQLRKSEIEAVKEAFTSGDIENLSPGQNKWRLSNAISFVATTTEDKYRALELERMSGKVAGLATGATQIEE
jgi:hypothetical protein